ncbi:MAG: hypothetical protein ABI237_12340 [Ginsengibacter sp.]
MLFKKQFPSLCFLLMSFHFSNAQIEGAYVTTKDFHAVGFGAFLNFSLPIQEVNYITIDAGYLFFKDKNTTELDLVPLLLGYRYTLDQTGSGWYVEPNAGYTFDVLQDWGHNAQGVAAGIGLGYLVDLGSIPFNFSARYEHILGTPASNIFSLRIAHSLSLRFRKSNDY